MDQVERVGAGLLPEGDHTSDAPRISSENGVPYSANTVLTEYFTRFDEPNGDTCLVVMTIVDDPQYITQPFITSTHFEKIPDAAGRNPTRC